MIKDTIFDIMKVESKTFVYSLLHNGQVFYIGITSNLLARYKAHLRPNKCNEKKNLFIENLLLNNQVPEMNIIARLDYKEAVKLEEVLIKSFSAAGIKLINSPFNHPRNWNPANIPENPTIKDMYKVIEFKQHLYIHQRSGNNGHLYNPPQPFL